jgi:hypothetical protein
VNIKSHSEAMPKGEVAQMAVQDVREAARVAASADDVEWSLLKQVAAAGGDEGHKIQLHKV